MGKEGTRGGDVEEIEIKSGEHSERQSQAATEGRGDGEVGQEWGVSVCVCVLGWGWGGRQGFMTGERRGSAERFG